MIHLLKIKKSYSNGIYNFKKGEVYIFERVMAFNPPPNIKEYTELIPIESIISKYNHANKDTKNVIIIRHGGMGDVIALSSIIDSLPKRVTFITDKSNFKLFDYFDTKIVTIRDIAKPIFVDLKYNDLRLLKANTSYLDFTNQIEIGGSKNWYEIFHEVAGIEFNPANGRPKLKLPTQRNEIDKILLCPRATANMRSISLAPLVKAIRKITDKQICVHLTALTDEDFTFAKENNVEILPKTTISEYINDLINYSLVISVDTFALHFREGLSLPAVGIYGAFTSESRTKYYQHTKSFNVSSTCQLQPCFLHQKKPNEVCPKANKNELTAPCLNDEIKLYKNLCEIL